MVLAELHWSLTVGQPIVATPPIDRPPVPRSDLLVGAGFECVSPRGGSVGARRAESLPDTVGPDMELLICGLNPSVVAADAGFGYAGPSNRFWKAAVEAGLVTRPRDPAAALRRDRIGMTDLVKRATPRSAELSRDEYLAGAARVHRLVEWLRPRAVCFVGLEGYRAAVDRRAAAGWQATAFGGRPAYVMPSTSGLNAHARSGDLIAHLRAALAEPPALLEDA
jgi:TDG/mug DNA glycosylase family protein